MEVIITCEHAGNVVPEDYKQLFIGNEKVLETHRGWDPGAYELAVHLSQSLGRPFHYVLTTRLLIELNRSLGHPQLFSEFSNVLSEKEKNALIDTIYLPYRNKIEHLISSSSRQVLHLSMHSFTPVLNDVTRELEVGLLFDPERKSEINFCEAFQESLKVEFPEFRIVHNEPYKGVDDGFTTYLRSKFTDGHYLGIEIEVNQKLVSSEKWNGIKEGMCRALRNIQP